ncbi:hypothetical protein [Stenomitos frigidus]|uniref:Uncharacterized protein n=1 Tax=Stenomitos frigidus ULC18 TaxID=2107698 RepID=A0A2T1E268_9CYAN|nr:hypothetical protein [Stenomitos frigidus]PSB26801.1 hypothetical protein C7B82_18255 [Stenomitos frigidus ULC18]
MSVSPLKNPVLPAAVLASAVFSSLTVPLAVLGSGPVDIQLNQEPVFSGTIKDFAAPYVGVVGILSIGAGVAGVAIAGWQQSSRKSGQVEAKLSSLQRKLEAKELQLQAAMLSEQRLEASGLDFFLEDETRPEAALLATATPPRVSVTQAKAPVNQTRISQAQSLQPAIDPEQTQATAQSVVSTLAAAQAFLSFTRSNGSMLPSDDGQLMAKKLPAANTSLQELQDQLKQIMSQVETLRYSLEAEPVVKPQQSTYTVNATEHLHHRPAAKSQWIMQSMAS